MSIRTVLPIPVVLLGFALLSFGEGPSPSDYNPKLAPASDEAEKAIPRFQMDKRLKATVWAAEPMLAHPVAFTFDERGRCFVCETFRLKKGVGDNRDFMHWLDDDLSNRTVAERVAMYKKHTGERFARDFESTRDRIRLLEDTTGSGKADKATVFSDQFKRAEDGLLAGVLARKGSLYATCIPDLLKFKTDSSDTKSEVMASGFGVHVAFLGHDMHGLIMGPDGKLYFSIGDRGLNVVNKEGKRLFYPDMGGVLRCDPDGSNLEMVHKGLRNPQELAFDDFGNLFTVDNNSDSGDKTRLTQIIEGGDSGWRTGYQYGSAMGNRGPFNAENIWHLREADQPTFITPPVSTIGDGPAGFVHYPGVGLDDRYKDHFFLCDFRGNAGNSGVRSFAVKPKGASFEMVDEHKFIWSLLGTDCDFGPDGAFYVSDWVEGWNQTGKGRLYKFSDAEAMKNPDVAKAKELIAGDWSKKTVPELLKLLRFPQQRVRMEAQYALAELGKNDSQRISLLGDVAKGATEKNLLARLHSIWAIGMIARASETAQMMHCNTMLIKLLEDGNAEIRAQSIKTIGEYYRGKILESHITFLLDDPDPRVRLMTAMALAKIKERRGFQDDSEDEQRKVLQEIRSFISSNADKDAYLRHAGVMLLASHLKDVHLDLMKNDMLPSVRLAALLALRKQNSPKVTEFFADKDPLIATEAIRAAHDLELTTTYPAIAALLSPAEKNPWVNFRTLNANYRLGGAKNAEAVAAFAASKDVAENLRVTALQMLAHWAKPPRRDYVTGLTQNLGERDGAIAVAAFQKHLAGLFVGSSKVAQEASKTASTLQIGEAGPLLAKLVADAGQAADSRIAALNGLAAIKSKELNESVKVAIASKEPKLRNAGRAVLAKAKPEEVLGQIAAVLKGSDTAEQQGAFAILATLKAKETETNVSEWLDKLAAKQVAPELQLDILEAAAAFKSGPIADKLKAYNAARPKADELAQYRESEFGGDAERGRDVFLKNAVQCQKCHKLDGIGGEVGPPLNGVGKQKREYLLESVVLPSKQIAKGYDSVLVITSNGKSHTGVLRGEDANEVKLIDADGKITAIKKADIEERKPSKSAMPDDLAAKLGKRDLRDIVEFLTTLKEEKK